jgi:DNA-binding beta-propeller fold protein YncE/mono/diheme cytochrome c family protein
MPVPFKRSTRLLPLACALAFAGCQTGVDDTRWSTGSTTVIASADYAVVHAVDMEGGTIASYELSSGITSQVDVGAEPTRLARLDTRILATVKGEREFVVLAQTDSGLEVVDRVGTAAEPYGIVTSEDGSRIYVAAASAGVVQEFDGADFRFLRDWLVPDEPRWLALHPKGTSLYVGSAFGGTVSHIDLAEDSVSRVDIPDAIGVSVVTLDQVDLTPRVTGDLAISPDGRALAVPMLFVDNVSTVGAPTSPGVPNPEGYGGGEDVDVPGSGSARFNPGVVTLVLDGDGVVLPDDSHVVNVATLDADGNTVRSYVNSITYSPDGETLLVTMEASDVVVALPAKPAREPSAGSGLGGRGTIDEGEMFLLDRFGNSLEPRPTTAIVTADGPRGVTFLSDDQAYVHNFIDRSVAPIAFDDVVVDRNDPVGPTAAMEAGTSVRYPSTLTPEVDQGRRLFYSASDSLMSAEGSGVSCSTCHLDARNDGLTWPLAEGARQTPSLAGEVSLTAPVTWNSEVPTVAHEVSITSQGRMGGLGLTAVQAASVAAYIDFTPAPDAPRRATEEAVLRGEEIFNREEVECSECHSGVAFTDNLPYRMFGLSSVRTRGLVGVASSAPYLHDGSAPDLGSLLERVRDGSMGDTSSLSAAEMADLRAYLESL